MSAEYNLVKFGSTWLTRDGSPTGVPCRIETNGVDGLWLDWEGSTARSTNGTPYTFVAENLGIGKILRMKPLVLTPTVLEDLKIEVNDAIDNSLTINVTITGETGNYDLECLPFFDNGRGPISASGRFSTGRIYDVEISVVTQSVNV